MKIVAHELGQLLYLIPLEELRPLHGIYPLTFVTKLAERYKFLTGPDLSEPWEKINSEGFKFDSGRIMKDGVELFVNSLGIYHDGIVVNCYTTDDAQTFLDDALEWAKAEFGLRRPTSIPRIRYQSHIIVEFDKQLSTLIVNFENITDVLGKYYSQLYGISNSPKLNRLSFRCDPQSLPQGAMETHFSLERRANHPFTDERFFSVAPLTSAAHVAILEEIEAFAQ
jgi:hypothetical protein